MAESGQRDVLRCLRCRDEHRGLPVHWDEEDGCAFAVCPTDPRHVAWLECEARIMAPEDREPLHTISRRLASRRPIVRAPGDASDEGGDE